MAAVTVPFRNSRAASPGVPKKADARPEEKENSIIVNTAPLDSQTKVLKETITAKGKTVVVDKVADEMKSSLATKMKSLLPMRFVTRRAVVVFTIIAAMVALGCLLFFFVGLPSRGQLELGLVPVQRFAAKIRGLEPSRTILALAGCLTAVVTLGGSAIFARRVLQAKRAKAAKTA